MATVTYTIGSPKQDGTRKVYFILSHKGKRKRISSNIDIDARDISRSGRIASRRIQKSVDDRLKDIKDRIYDLKIDIMGRDVDVEWIYSHLTKTDDMPDFFEFARTWLGKSRLKGNKNYISMLNPSLT